MISKLTARSQRLAASVLKLAKLLSLAAAGAAFATVTVIAVDYLIFGDDYSQDDADGD